MIFKGWVSWERHCWWLELGMIRNYKFLKLPKNVIPRQMCSVYTAICLETCKSALQDKKYVVG